MSNFAFRKCRAIHESSVLAPHFVLRIALAAPPSYKPHRNTKLLQWRSEQVLEIRLRPGKLVGEPACRSPFDRSGVGLLGGLKLACLLFCEPFGIQQARAVRPAFQCLAERV